MAHDSTEHTDPRHYVDLAWRWKWLLLAIIILIPLAAYLVSARSPKTYEASTTLLVQGTTITTPLSSTPIAVSTSSASGVARLIKTPVVGNLAARKLGEPPSSGRSLLPSVTAEVESSGEGESAVETNFLTITTQASTPQRAAALARAFANAVTTTRTRDATTALDAAIHNLSADAAAEDDRLTEQSLAAQVQQLQALRPTLSSRTDVVDPPVVPTEPISPKPMRNAALGFILALLIAAGSLPLLDRLDRRLRQAEEVEPLLDAPLLGMIPQAAFPGNRPNALVRESFQTLRAGLTSFNVDRSLKSIAIVSATHGDGKTTVATNLAAALAVDARDVIIVDGDMRRPQTGTRLGVEAGVGLDAVLLGEKTVEEALVEVRGLTGGRLRVLPSTSPPPNPSVLLGSERMSELLNELTEMADMVVIDTPPLLVVSDAIPLLKHVTGTVLVVRVNQTTRDAIKRSRQVIESAGGTILGTVATATKAGGLYGYGIGEYMLPGDLEAEHQNGVGGGGLERFRDLLDRVPRPGSKKTGSSS